MKRFLIKTLSFLVILIATFCLIFLSADGYSDPFYVRFTTPKQTSLILGTSRAAQGLRPEFINESLSREDIFNYSFTVAHSPYGPAYLESIERKLKYDAKDGVFIVTVDPWSIANTLDDPNDVSRFPENDMILGTTTVVDQNPNFQYLVYGYESSYFELFRRKTDMYLHKDGWLEVNINMDRGTLEKRISQKLTEYKTQNLPKYRFSQKRLDFLEKTISKLKKHGSVYLVRLPIHPGMMDIENELMDNFNNKMILTAGFHNVPYLDMTFRNSDFLYTDGNHLYKDSGKEASMLLADWIKEEEMNPLEKQ